MSKIIAVPVDWTVYEVEDDLITYMNSAVQVLPPFIVLESLVLSGKARRITTETVKDESPQTMPWYPDGEQPEEDDDNGDS